MFVIFTLASLKRLDGWLAGFAGLFELELCQNLSHLETSRWF
jgi:hypothetical protein